MGGNILMNKEKFWKLIQTFPDNAGRDCFNCYYKYDNRDEVLCGYASYVRSGKTYVTRGFPQTGRKDMQNRCRQSVHISARQSRYSKNLWEWDGENE